MSDTKAEKRRRGVRATLLAARGVPREATVGSNGLERALDERLTGTPGGTLIESFAHSCNSVALDGVPVAGKTGTAELGVTQNCDAEAVAAGACDPGDTTDTDAWFVGYAPAGGDTAAPVARELISAGLTAAPVT